MIIAIASGKGGTGKTTVATSLALSLNGRAQLLDCDVEEPNAHIFIQPIFSKKQSVTIKIPKIDLEKCNYCGECSNVCAFNAIAVTPSSINIFYELCHSCGACQYFCKQKALCDIEKTIGVIEIGKNDSLDFIHGKLNVGVAISVPLIRAVKQCIDYEKNIILDVPPGTSCPMVHSVIGADFCILVTEPTPFGLNDLKLAIGVLDKLKIPFGVIINRSDIGNTEVDNFCKDQDISILMRIPFSRDIAKSYSLGRALVIDFPEYKEKFIKLFQKISGIIYG